jgi:cytochrome c oxidase subunit 2
MQLPVPQVRVPFAPEQASTFAGEVDALYLYLVLITLFFSTVITAAIVFFAVRYRRRDPGEVPRPRAGSLPLEITWTVIPLMIAMTIFAWGASVYFRLYRAPKEAMEIYVVGKQWMWKFQHPTGQREINELHVPLGTRIKLTMTTEDVIHSLYVPAFRVKTDVVPGRYTQMWFEPTKAGRYYLFCAEYCGTNHSGMGGYVEVMEPTEFQQWLAGGASESAAAQGLKVFQERGCASCHQEDRQGRGPVLNNIFGKPQQLSNGETVTVDEAYIRNSILDPHSQLAAGFGPLMPVYRGQLSEEQILQLIAYIRSLTDDPQAQQGGGAGTVNEGTSPTSQRSNPVGPTTPQQPARSGEGTTTPRGGSSGAGANRQGQNR